jgi:hypothetical protein
VVPKKILLQTFLASLSLGAALALWIVGLTGDLPALRWAFPAVLIALMLLTRYLPWWRGDRQAAQLKAAAQQSKQP